MATQRGFIVAMRIRHTVTDFRRVVPDGGPADIDIHRAKAWFNGAIEALLTDGAPRERVSQARGYLVKLQHRESHIAEELVSELRCIIDDLDKRVSENSADLLYKDEQDLTERLFSLYLDLSDGMLMW